MVDPRTAHHIDARTYLSLLPHVDQSDLFTIRGDFARYLSTRQSLSQHATWQDAWNEWTSATPHRPGGIHFTPPRCKTCKGKGFDVRHVSRNLARTGNPHVCGDCRGSRRGTRTRQVARYATPPGPLAPEGWSYQFPPSHASSECRELGEHDWVDPDTDDTSCRRCACRRTRQVQPS